MDRYGGRAERAREAVVRAAASAGDVQEFFDRVVAAVSPVLPFDVWAGVTVDPATLMNTGGNYRNAVPDRLMPRMLDIEYREGDVNSLPELARRPVPVGLLSREVGGRLERSPRYRDIAGPLGYRDELRILLRDRYGSWGALVLGRGRDVPGFRASDLELAGALARPLGDALRRLHLARRAQEEPSATAPALVLLDGDYRIRHRSRSAALWLDELRGPGPEPAPHRLPPPVYAVAAAVRDPAAAGSLASWASTRGHGRVRLHAWLLEGPQVQVAVAVEPAGPGEHTAFLLTAYGLTPRERAVTELVLHGRSTAEIGRLARLSQHTVQDHLKSVFDKTGVRSRRDLVAAVFGRHYRPALERGAGAPVPSPEGG